MPWVKDRKGERFMPPPKPEVPHTQAVKQWGRRMLVDMYKLYAVCPHKVCRRKHACSMAEMLCWEETRLIFAEKIIPKMREAYEAEEGKKQPEPYDPDVADLARERRHWAAGDAVKPEGRGGVSSDGDATTDTSPRRRPGSRAKARQAAAPTGSRAEPVLGPPAERTRGPE